MEFDAGGEHYTVPLDPESAGTNRARAKAALAKIKAAQDTINEDDGIIDQIDDDLTTLNSSPTNAQVLAVVINIAERQKQAFVYLSKIGDYLTAIIKFVLKAVKNGMGA
jgi:hypothetical protein